MPVEEKNLICDAVVQKMTSGIRLDADEKAHLAICEHCMAQVITALDEAAMRSKASGRTDDDHERPGAKKALAHGLEVFEREFGISLSKD